MRKQTDRQKRKNFLIALMRSMENDNCRWVIEYIKLHSIAMQ